MIWLIAAGLALTAATAWFLARPLTQVPVAANEEYQQLQQLRERLLAQLNELDIESVDRNMDATTVADERLRLESELAQTLRRLDVLNPQAVPAVPIGARTTWWRTLVTIGLLLPLAGAGLYALNQKHGLRQFSGAAPEAPPAAAVPPMVLEMVARLEKRLAEQPDDGAGWARLGRAYGVLGRPEDAKAAFARAERLAPNDTAMLTEYAWLLYSQDPNNIAGPALGLYQRLYKLDPGNQDAMWFLGFVAYQKGNYREALNLWERLLKALPADHPTAEHLRDAIASAREKLRR
jgi:cytochrome c-type biogenesis protein CcmH